MRKTGTGIFARAFTRHFPRIPVEEAGRLHDPLLREHFIEKIFSLQRWRQLIAREKTLGGLVEFHTQNKLLLKTLDLKTTWKKNINVLLHIMGFFKKKLTPDETQEMLTLIDRYGEGHVPLVVPLTLVNHYVRKYDQTYLNPHPFELKLRNYF